MSQMNPAADKNQPENPLLDSRKTQSLVDYVRAYFRRLASGDLGILPIIIGLIGIAIIFQSQNSNFLTPRNFVNLILQMSGITMMAYGVVFVLLLGEIDLSIGYVSAVGGVATALLLRETEVITLFNEANLGNLSIVQWFLLLIGRSLEGIDATFPFQARLFMFLRFFGWLLFPLIFGGTRLAWHFYFNRDDEVARRRALIQAVSMAAAGLLFGALFILTDGWTWYTAIATGILATALVGLLQGGIITFFQVPSFIVTLAGLLAWNGVVLRMIGGSGTVIIQDDIVRGIAGDYLPIIWQAEQGINLLGYQLGKLTLSWGLLVVLAFVVLFAVIQFFQYNTRKSHGLSTRPISVILFQIIGIAVAGIIISHIVDQDRGFPIVGLLLLVALVVLTFVANNTQFGRFVYAVGGNAEAARRAGINVTQIRVIVFILSSTLAGLGGLILASRLGSVATNAGGGNILLNAIAAAVIGGTSLFGGRGYVSSAVLGALVIASVENGMGLLNVSSGDKFVITGIVLLVAVIVDALSRRRQQQSGIA